jgi:hypothetical protein
MLWEDLRTNYPQGILKQLMNFIDLHGFRSESNSWVWKNRRLDWKLLCIVGTLVNMRAITGYGSNKDGLRAGAMTPPDRLTQTLYSLPSCLAYAKQLPTIYLISVVVDSVLLLEQRLANRRHPYIDFAAACDNGNT